MSQIKMTNLYKRQRDSSEGPSASSGNGSNSSPFISSMPSVSPIPSVPDDFDLNDLPSDPAERMKILKYHPNLRGEIRRKYLLKGPCQPRDHDFPKKKLGKTLRRFNKAWFDQYPNWLEYSIKEDKAFCLCCYLFKDQCGKQGGGDAFVTEGFSSWNKTERLASHVGDVNSAHNKALTKCENLMRQEQSISTALKKQSDIQKKENRIRLSDSDDTNTNKSISGYVRDARDMDATPADVVEDHNSYDFVIDMGLKSGDIKVQIEDDNVLMISGERKVKEVKEGAKYVRMERMIGKFMRKFTLPENADTDKISAMCQDGVLTVTVEKLPPPQSKKPKTIEVKSA